MRMSVGRKPVGGAAVDVVTLEMLVLLMMVVLLHLLVLKMLLVVEGSLFVDLDSICLGSPVLEPDLDLSIGHAQFLGQALSDLEGWSICLLEKANKMFQLLGGDAFSLCLFGLVRCGQVHRCGISGCGWGCIDIGIG